MKINTTTLAGTAVLAALVVVFDYTLKYSNLKMPFPLAPELKFDFTGIPVVLSFLLFGLIPGIFTSAIASVAILSRSGVILGSSMKGLAEFSTVIGMAIGLKLFKQFKIFSSSLLGVISRVLIMVCVNFALIYAGVMSISVSYANVPLIYALLLGFFNTIQGIISIVGGYSIYEAIKRRVPSLIEKATGSQNYH
jgi:riboflavin transporter FmnP